MTVSLEFQQIRNTYRGLVVLNYTNNELSNSLTTLKDGAGNESALKISTDKVGISDYVFPQTDGAANQVLATDGNGNLDWITIVNTSPILPGDGLQLFDNTFSVDNTVVRTITFNELGDVRYARLSAPNSFGNAVRLPDGSGSIPAYSFNSDTDTGIYRTPAGNLAFSIGGSAVARIEYTGSSTFDGLTVLTREKGDGRYWQVANLSSLSQLNNSPGYVSAAQIVGNGGIEIRVSGTTNGKQIIVSAEGIDLSNYVNLIGNQSIAGTKTFTSNIIGNLTGNAATATALATSRTFSITGQIGATGVAFDGTGNVTLNVDSLNASNLNAGTIPDARLSNNVVTTAIGDSRYLLQKVPYVIELSGSQPYTFQEGTDALNQSITFKITSNFIGSTAIVVTSGCRIDNLSIYVSSNVTNCNRGISIRNKCQINRLVCESSNQLVAVSANTTSYFVTVSGNDTHISSIRMKNIDRGMSLYNVSAVSIGTYEHKSYWKGLQLRDCENCTIGNVHTWVASISTSAQPGENGIGIVNSKNISFGICHIEDSGEHGIYIGGGDTDISNNISFATVMTSKTGQSGFKVKGETLVHQNIAIGQLTVVDAAWGTIPGPNEDGLRVENVKGFQCGSVSVHTKDASKSCYYGIYLDGVQNAYIGGGMIADSASDAIHIRSDRQSTIALSINNLNGRDIGGNVLNIESSAGSQFRDILVAGGMFYDVTGVGFKHNGNSNTWPSPGVIDFRIHNASALTDNTSTDTNLYVSLTNFS